MAEVRLIARVDASAFEAALQSLVDAVAALPEDKQIAARDTLSNMTNDEFVVFGEGVDSLSGDGVFACTWPLLPSEKLAAMIVAFQRHAAKAGGDHVA